MKGVDLPVYREKDRILDAISGNQVIVVESPTGSGKTTQIPQILFEAGYTDSGIIGVTQPRRIAAVSVSEFIARQMGKKIPDTIGYKMRFEDKTDLSTRIKIMTDGILLQEIKADYSLSRYSIIMVDEAHERSLNIDFILGLLKRILRERSEFKVIVSSATINAEIFSEYFDECPIVKIETSPFPVEIAYEPPKKENSYDSLLEKITEIVKRTIDKHDKGNILIFLPGQRAIKECLIRLAVLEGSKQLKLLPLYARLTSNEQEKVFPEYPGRRKVIVATNIAESSVTIDGITAVIDPGQAKINYYNQKTYTSSLVEIVISRASCNQRKGRAGRTAPGICYRLYDRKSYESRPLFTQEEIFRTDLSEVVLRMAEIGLRDFEDFDFLSPPGSRGIISAIATLRLLDALDEERNLTETGLMMVRFPMLPKHSRMIVEAILSYPRVLEEVVIASSFLSANSPFLLPMGEEMEARKAHHNFKDPLGDFLSYLKIYRAYRSCRDRDGFCRQHYLDREVLDEIVNINTQIEEIISEMGIPILSGGSAEDYLCAVSRGLIQFVCTKVGRRNYRSLTAKSIQIHPASVMFHSEPQYIVAGEIVRTTRTYARSVSRLKPEWLKKISPVLYQKVGEETAGKETAGKEKKRDFTNQIKIGTGVFEIAKEKGKKVVVLPWQELKKALRGIDLSYLPKYRDLRGKILYEGCEILGGARLATILPLVNKIQPEKGILKYYERRNYIYPSDDKDLCRYLGSLLALCPRKRKSNRLGFLTLYTDENGTYWYRSTRYFNTSLLESLSSLEILGDAVGKTHDSVNSKIVNAAYHRLSAILES
jgi:RNA helicase HrpA